MLLRTNYQVVLDFVFKIALWYFDRFVVFVFSVVLLIVDFRVVLFASVPLNTKLGFFISIGRFDICRLLVVLFDMDASDVPFIGNLSVVLLARDFVDKLLNIEPLNVTSFLIGSVLSLFLIILINVGELSVVLFVAKLSIVIINFCDSSIQLLFVTTFDFKVSTVLLATDLGVIINDSTLIIDCGCTILIVGSS